MNELMSRGVFVAGVSAATIVPTAATAGAPYKFIGKKVDLHGVVGPSTDPDSINLNSPSLNGLFVVVLASSRNLEQGQRIRILGTVQKPVQGENNTGGSGTYAVVRKAFLE